MDENSALRPVYVQKADMATAQLTSGGKLVREQVDNFIVVAIKEGKMLKLVRVTTISRDEREIPKMTTFGSRIWHAATEMEELPLAYRVRPGFDKVTITTAEMQAQVNFPKYFLKAQVEGPRFQQTMIAYLGLHSARDWDDKILNGDTTSTDDLLALHDGMRVRMTTNTFAAGTAALSASILDTTELTMPDEYAEQDGLAYFTSRRARAAYRREWQARIGNNADANILNNPPSSYGDIPIVVIPMIPTTLGVGANETVVLYLNPKQFVYAVEEDVELETEYSKKARMWSVIMTARTGQNFEHEPATVQTDGVLST
uniref:Putative capsid protein n=1 Tax=viral metagenome TaxID=1070528 RepID=A0A6H1Z7Q2_9ZZZZ